MAHDNLTGRNLLYKESSPYLLQHANNPVDWLAWNANSLALAKQQHKPILLSIGYSTCHWCHVMAHESFEDAETAAIMNELYINIKVDREERPDLDKIYQTAHSLLAQRPGGWPLTVFLTPDTNMPIFAGTYFPLTAKHGLPAFKTILRQVHEAWLNRKPDISRQSDALQSTYQHIYEASRPADTDFNSAIIDIARNQIEQQFDSEHGGFSEAPKFPHPAILGFALTHWCYTKQQNRPDSRILHCAIFTLEKMANGGVFDHLGGGFCRYSTDNHWIIPHFEKMLYDNGPLLSLYSQAWKITGSPLFFDTACETASWVIREMQSDDGGYYSAQDADSEGVEGKFFVWSRDEINMLLQQAADSYHISTDTIALFRDRFGLDAEANFEGSWHLHGYRPEAAIAGEHHYDETELHRQFRLIRQHLFEHREQRVHPATDTKILCAWNGLMIQGMATAGRLLDKPAYIESAMRAANFLKKHCWKDNQLFAVYANGQRRLNAYLDDYAFLIFGLLELLQSRWDNELYAWALELAGRLQADFEDTSYGGFYFTSHHHEQLIQRLKIFSDDAVPAGNAVAALALSRLGYLAGEPRFIKTAENCLKSAWHEMSSSPLSHSAMLTALNEYLRPPGILVMRTRDHDTEKWQAITRQYHLPLTLIYNIPAQLTLHASLNEKAAGNTSLAYPCSGMSCQKPLTDATGLHEYLRNNSYRVSE